MDINVLRDYIASAKVNSQSTLTDSASQHPISIYVD